MCSSSSIGKTVPCHKRNVGERYGASSCHSDPVRVRAYRSSKLAGVIVVADGRALRRLMAVCLFSFGIAERDAAAQVAFVGDPAIWQAAAIGHVDFPFTEMNVAFANEVGTMPGPNAQLGPTLTFSEAGTHFESAFTLQTLEPGAGFTFDDTEASSSSFRNALSIGDIDDYENDDFEIVVGGRSVYAMGIDFRNNNLHSSESIEIFGIDGSWLGSHSPLPDGDAFFGVFSSDPIGRIVVDERADGDDIAIGGIRFTNNRVEVGCSYEGVYLPNCDRSFADQVWHYDPMYGGGPAPAAHYATPDEALGPHGSEDGYVSLGRGGLLELVFTDNVLTNSGDDLLDLRIFEIGPDVEDTFVSVRPTPATRNLLDGALDENGDGFYEVGKVLGSIDSVDIDSFFPGFPAGALRFDAVQLVDDRNEGNPTGATVGADISAVAAISSSTPDCDFNHDGFCNIDDVNALLVRGPIAIGQLVVDGEDETFDLNADKRIDRLDLDVWLASAAAANGHSRPYFKGDANLDGVFGTTDLITIFQAGEYEDNVVRNSRWQTGDWTGDLEFDTSDLIAAFQDGGFSSNAEPQIVPEPATMFGLIFGWAIVFHHSLLLRRAVQRPSRVVT